MCVYDSELICLLTLYEGISSGDISNRSTRMKAKVPTEQVRLFKLFLRAHLAAERLNMPEVAKYNLFTAIHLALDMRTNAKTQQECRVHTYNAAVLSWRAGMTTQAHQLLEVELKSDLDGHPTIPMDLPTISRDPPPRLLEFCRALVPGLDSTELPIILPHTPQLPQTDDLVLDPLHSKYHRG